MKIKITFISLLLVAFSSFSQYKELSNNAEISIITIGQGENLYDTFGHCAIRVKDKTNNFDNVYNYGVFDFETPGFYMKFMRGQLLYDLETAPTHLFLRNYVHENREINEQILELKQKQKQHYFEFLENNAKPENKKYLYDFFYDNCSTKLREVTTKVLKEKVDYNDELLSNNLTFRDLIYQELDNHPWSKFGIDIALGSIIDKKASSKETTFLPKYIFKNFKNAIVFLDGKELPLVKKTNYLYKVNVKKNKISKTFFPPLVLTILLAIIILFITLKNFKNKSQNKLLDFIILFVTGLVGLLVFLLWFATDHKTTVNNFNIFWAFTPNLFVAFQVFKNKKFLKNYYLLLLLLLLLNVVFWIFKIQIFNLALIPILISLAVRYFYLWKSYEYNKLN